MNEQPLPVQQPQTNPQPLGSPQVEPYPVPSPQPPSKKKKTIIWVIIAVLVLAMVAIGLSIYASMTKKTTSTAKPSAKIGVMIAFTGGSSSMGYGAMKGVQLAKKELGASNIEVIQADSRCEVEKAREQIKKLIKQGVVAIIGDGCSSASTATLPIANASKIPMLSPSASSASLTIPNDYFFRVVPSDNYQAEYMAQAMYKRGAHRVAVFYTNEVYGANMSKIFQTKFQNIGGQIVTSAFAESDDIELAAQVQQINATKPDAIFIAPNSLNTATAFAQTMRSVNKTVPMYGGDIFYDQTIIKNAPDASDGLVLTSFPRGTDDFKKRIRQEFRTTDQLYAAAQSYDAFTALYKLLGNGAKTGEEIKNGLTDLSFQGVTGPISFDRNGEVAGTSYRYDLLQIKDGSFTDVVQ